MSVDAAGGPASGVRRALIVVSTLAAAISLGAALRNAVSFSIDFRIDAARVLAVGVSPFEGAEGGTFYLHALYVGLLPLGWLSDAGARLAFGLLNVGLGLLLVRTLARGLELDRLTTVVLGLIMVTSTPFRVTVGNAQTGLIVLALAAPFFVLRGRSGAALVGGISLVKWSFAPLLLWVLVRRRVRDLLLFGVIPLSGFLIFGSMVSDLSSSNLLRPFVQERAILVDLGHADLMTLVRQLVGDGGVAIVAPLVLMAGLSVVIVRTFRDERIAFAALLIVSLVTVYHLSYDLIALLPAVAISLGRPRHHASRAILLIAGYFFYIDLGLKVAESIEGFLGGGVGAGPLSVVIEALDEVVRSPGPAVVLLHLLALLTVGFLLYVLDRDRDGAAGPTPMHPLRLTW